MEDRSYNGWSNYATWLVHLHLTNTQAWYDALNALTAAHASDEDHGLLAESIKDYAEDTLLARHLNEPSDQGRFATDLMRGTLDECNYREIAKHLREEA